MPYERNARFLEFKPQRVIDDELLGWLCPSHWEVERQLQLVNKQRYDGTLRWVLDMPELTAWLKSKPNSDERILWICGGPGIGKSVMAGFLIEKLKETLTDSIVVYFFCKSGEPKLTEIRAIIQTLAYKCMQTFQQARSVLEALKKAQFPISPNTSIRLLFTKLIAEPLKCVSQDVYIILDGLDEADTVTMDAYEMREEVKILIECLGSLKTAHILFISPPEVSLDEDISNLPIKSIGENENSSDIETYIREQFSKSGPLRKWYTGDVNGLVKSLISNSRGLFLWVFIVLQDLSTAKDKRKFENCLSAFLKSSGRMDDLYSAILSRIHEDDQDWIREILQWVVVAQRALAIEELAAAVEWSLGNERFDFQRFLEVECGSLIMFTPGSQRDKTVYLVHETLCSFLLDRQKCDAKWRIDEEITHGYVALKCMESLSIEDDSNIVNKYAAMQWVAHLSRATSAQQSAEILASLHQFFESRAVNVWVKTGLIKLPYFRYGLILKFEEPYLESIALWVERTWRNIDDLQKHISVGSGTDLQFVTLEKWSREV